MAKWLMKADPIILASWFRWVVLIAVLCLLIGCASTPKVGPCFVKECGIECCNNDGKRCPPCGES